MKRADAIRVLSQCLPELQSHFGVVQLELFGSVARDEARSDSDVDVLVTFTTTPSYTSFMELKAYLEDQLGTQVDLVTRKGLRARVKPEVDREAIRVA